MKGRAMEKEICFWKRRMKTLPNETAIKIYKIVHTGPNKYAGGAQVGLISSLKYFVVLFICVLDSLDSNGINSTPKIGL